ncbi:MAG: hypothetical protein LDLANPLL_00517 [Turneriella sp.]|nr:hypothetical protein [Turneriella sp.]
MLLYVHAKAGSKKTGIERVTPSEWIVRVHERAIDGKANTAIIKAIAKELRIAPSCIHLVSGEKSKHKKFEIHESPI